MKMKIDRFKELESIPSIPRQVLKALNGIEEILAVDYDIVHMIHYDAPIALGVLKLANSSMYGYPYEVFSLQRAAELVGPGAIKNVILTTSIFEQFENPQNSDVDLELIALWLHTAVTASVAEGIGALIDDLDPDVCFTAGLIKDCGLIALVMNYPELINDIVKYQADDKMPLFKAEQEVIGATHAEIGALMLENWGFPKELSEAIKNCCEADNGNPESKLSGVIGLAKFLAESWGYGYATLNGLDKDITPLLEAINLPMKEFSSLERRLKDNATHVANMVKN